MMHGPINVRFMSKSFRKYLSDIRGKHDVKELQKAAVLGTELVLRKALM
jgi:hypothetical protein